MERELKKRDGEVEAMQRHNNLYEQMDNTDDSDIIVPRENPRRRVPRLKVKLPYGVELIMNVMSEKYVSKILGGASKLVYHTIQNHNDASPGRQQTKCITFRTSGPYAQMVRTQLTSITLRYFKNTWYAAALHDVRLLRSVQPMDTVPLGNQAHHMDYVHPEYASFYSAMIGLQGGTRVVFCLGNEEQVVEIPPGAMLVWFGNVPHGGAAYSGDNYRLFFKVIAAGVKIKDAAHLELGYFHCTHNVKVDEKLTTF